MRGRVFWPAVVIGWAIMAGGVVGLIVDGARTRPANWVRWFGGGLLVHDLLFAPVVLGGGWLLTRWLPRWVRPVVQAALIVAGVLTLIAAPLIRGYGARAANPSVQPRDYGAGLAAAIAVVAALSAIEIVRRAVVRRRSA